ncbi:MAG TPA: hypothetical protein VNT32_15570 [Thermoleophilaceae bacterium]|nr:hypothetical protein [Thermoleophilaceae bacterium]
MAATGISPAELSEKLVDLIDRLDLAYEQRDDEALAEALSQLGDLSYGLSLSAA